MTLPVWFVGIIATILAGQLLAGIAWAVRTDKAAAVARAEQAAQFAAMADRLGRIESQLTKHDPVVVRGELDGILRRAEDLESKYAAHHRLLRHLTRRLDKASIPEVAASEADG